MSTYVAGACNEYPQHMLSFVISPQRHVVGTHQKHLIKVLLMSTPKKTYVVSTHSKHLCCECSKHLIICFH